VYPPLQLSHQVVQFKATALFDSSIVSVFVLNNHLDKNEFKHFVPRIGAGKCYYSVLINSAECSQWDTAETDFLVGKLNLSYCSNMSV